MRAMAMAMAAALAVGCARDEYTPREVTRVHEDTCGAGLANGDEVIDGDSWDDDGWHATKEIPALSDDVLVCDPLPSGLWECAAASGLDVLTYVEPADKFDSVEYRLDRQTDAGACAVTFSARHPLELDEGAVEEVVVVGTLGPVGMAWLFLQALGGGYSAIGNH